jgi:hypothetical protein
MVSKTFVRKLTTARFSHPQPAPAADFGDASLDLSSRSQLLPQWYYRWVLHLPRALPRLPS